jgi:hypothetical protein
MPHSVSAGICTYQIAIDGLNGPHYSVLAADHLAHDLGLRDLLLVCGGLLQRFRQRLDSQLPHARADIEGLNPLGPERLITEERLDDCWLCIISRQSEDTMWRDSRFQLSDWPPSFRLHRGDKPHRSG